MRLPEAGPHPRVAPLPCHSNRQTCLHSTALLAAPIQTQSPTNMKMQILRGQRPEGERAWPSDFSSPEITEVCRELGFAVGSPKWRGRVDWETSLGALHRSSMLRWCKCSKVWMCNTSCLNSELTGTVVHHQVRWPAKHLPSLSTLRDFRFQLLSYIEACALCGKVPSARSLRLQDRRTPLAE